VEDSLRPASDHTAARTESPPEATGADEPRFDPILNRALLAHEPGVRLGPGLAASASSLVVWARYFPFSPAGDGSKVPTVGRLGGQQ
jgi:hypothetical protein